MQASILVTGQIDHDGDRSVGAHPRRPPDVLIDPQGLHSGQPLLLPDPGLRLDLDGIPAGVPIHAEMGASADTVVSSWLGASVAQATDRVVSTARAGARSCSSLNVAVLHIGSRHRQIRFSQRTRVTRPKAGCVVQQMNSAAVANRDHTAAGAAVLDLVGLHGEHQPVLLVDRDGEDVHPGNVEHSVGPGAPARARTTHRVVHRRGFRSECLVASDLEGPDALNPAPPRPLRRYPQPRSDPKSPFTQSSVPGQFSSLEFRLGQTATKSRRQ